MSDWRRVEEIVHAALERQPADRSVFIGEACGTDETLRAEVESLLTHATAAEASVLRIGNLSLQMVGRQIGSYRVESLIGAGGMGEVYRARDTKLQRDVAIKVLPPGLSTDRDRRARFDREARALASLNHPHVGAIYGFEESAGVLFLILELVEGQTLAERIKGVPLPSSDALRVARQIAEALDSAHEKGIIHRDLKPANVKLTPDGNVKVLDFGLAKFSQQVDQVSIAPTETIATRDGAVFGTPAYMSPEQARGEPVDKRADVWAFGCVLYEILSGHSPFAGPTVSDTISNVMRSEPDWSRLAQTPPGLRRLLQRLLEKDPKRRIRDIGDVRLELDEVPLDVGLLGPGTASSRAPRVFAVVAIAAVMLAAGIVLGRATTSSTALAVQPIAQAIVSQLTSYDGTESSGAISPDGRSFVFTSDMGGTPDIWLRQVAGGEPVRLTNDQIAESGLTFTPDGEQIYFSRTEGNDVSVWRIGALGGQARKVLSDAQAPAVSRDGRQLASFARGQRGFSLTVSALDGSGRRTLVENVLNVMAISRPAWSPDGRLIAYTSGGLFAPRNLFVVDSETARARQVTAFTQSTEGTNSQAWLPDNRHVVVSYAASPRALGPNDLGVVDVQTGSITRLTTNIASAFDNPSFSADGNRLLVTSVRVAREVWKVPIGEDPVASGKAAVKLLESSFDPMWVFVTRDGRTLLYNNDLVGSRNLWTMPIDNRTSSRQITSMPGNAVMHASLSPDGTRVAFASNASGNSDVWIQHLDGSGLRQLTNDTAAESWPVWSPDGRAIMFGSLRDGAWETRRVPADGGPAEKFMDGFFRGDWIAKPDGTGDLIVTSNAGGGLRLIDPERRTVLWHDAPPGNGMPMFSPDAKFVSVAVRESRDRDAVWVYDVATGTPKPAVRFPEPFQLFFRVSWVDGGRAFVVNRGQSISNIVMFDRFWMQK